MAIIIIQAESSSSTGSAKLSSRAAKLRDWAEPAPQVLITRAQTRMGWYVCAAAAEMLYACFSVFVSREIYALHKTQWEEHFQLLLSAKAERAGKQAGAGIPLASQWYWKESFFFFTL